MTRDVNVGLHINDWGGVVVIHSFCNTETEMLEEVTAKRKPGIRRCLVAT